MNAAQGNGIHRILMSPTNLCCNESSSLLLSCCFIYNSFTTAATEDGLFLRDKNTR